MTEWIELYNENRHDKAVLLLVGNKVDLPVREVSFEEASSRAKQLGVEYYETSAKTSVNIERLFNDAARFSMKDLDLSSSMISSNVRPEKKTETPSSKLEYTKNSSPVIELNNAMNDASRRNERGCCG